MAAKYNGYATLMVMRYLPLLSILILASCNSSMVSTGQDMTVSLIGTDAAYCVIDTGANRYLLNAPGTVFVERDEREMKIDCDDNNTDRRRVVKVESHMGAGYWNYPKEVTVDFSKFDNGTRFTGYRAYMDGYDAPSTDEAIKEVLTEDSYSSPVVTRQDYPVHKTYYMGRRSLPVEP